MRKIVKGSLFGFFLALILALALPNSVLATQTQMSATGTVMYISDTIGFLAGASSNYKVMSRTVNGYFTSGDLTGDYTFKYKGNIDLNTQSGNINGQLTTSTYIFELTGKSFPFSQTGNILVSSASGTWVGHNWPGSGTFSATYYFELDEFGHIARILPESTFTISGQWNVR